jgi:hypothetical protein
MVVIWIKDFITVHEHDTGNGFKKREKELFTMNADPNPDPAFQVNPDPGFLRPKTGKEYSRKKKYF